MVATTRFGYWWRREGSRSRACSRPCSRSSAGPGDPQKVVALEKLNRSIARAGARAAP
jgi:hypothetical protein